MLIAIARRCLTTSCNRGLSTLPAHTVVGLPALSPTMDKGNLGAWKVKEGGKIGPGTALVEIETDKATLDFEATDDGILAKHLVKSGTQNVPVGFPIAVIVENAEDVAAFADFKIEQKEASVAAAAPHTPAAAKPVQSVKPAPVTPVTAPAAAAPVAAPAAAAPVAATPATPAPASPAKQPSAPSSSSKTPLLAVNYSAFEAYDAKYGSTLLVPRRAVVPASKQA